MTQEGKQLLLKDLCGRLPYGVKFNYGGYDGCDYKMEIVSPVTVNNSFPIEDCKPYLRPMSSMTDEELKEFTGFASISQHRFFIGDSYFWYNTYEEEDWLLAHHFDYRRLIEKGLALAAPEDMYKTE